jgi:hypothetical protein
MDEESKSGKMDQNTKAIGRTIWPTEKDDSSIQMVMSIKENGSMTKPTV